VIQKNDDGTISYLCSNKEWLLHYFNKLYPKIGAFEQNHELSNLDFVAWGNLSADDPILKDSKEIIAVNNGITLIEKIATGTRFYNLGNNNNATTVNDYIENLAILHEFIKIFAEKAQRLTQIAYDTRFILPSGKNNQLILYEQKAISQKLNRLYLDKDIFLTMREIECIEWYASGKTSVEISEILHISKRTVESHIDHIKQKTGCINLFQLGYMLARLKFKNFSYIPNPY
jgi:DNA-binding CsgD family transcriptional regulator